MENQNKQKTTMKYGQTAAIFTALVLLITIVINVVAYMGANKLNLKFDMTSSKIYEITQTTKDVVSGINKKVELIAVNNESKVSADFKAVLDNFAALSENIQLRYVDPNENPNFAAEYAAKGTVLYVDSIIVKTDLREKVFTPIDMYNVDTATNTIASFKAEQQITSAIKYVTNEKIPVAAFVQGHNEYMGNAFPSLFTQNNYETSQITLSVQDIEDAVELVVIAAPTRDFEPSEIKKLDAYMARGGNLMVFQHPSATIFSNLGAFLEEWGITVGEYVVFEEKNHTGSPVNIVPMYYPHMINNYFSDNQYFMVTPQSRNINLVEKAGKTVAPVLVSSDKAYGKTGTEFTTTKKESGDKQQQFVLAATSEEMVTVNGEKKTAKLFVSGSRNLYYDDIINVSSYANAEFLTQVMSWCGGGMEVVNVPAKTMNASNVNITAFVALVLAALLTLIIPLCILGYGVSVFLKRRHL